MTYPIGNFRELVKFQRRTSAADGYGNQATSWYDLTGPQAARIRPLKGQEMIVDGRLSGISDFEITVMSNSIVSTVTTEDRITNVRTGVTYNITSTNNPDERGAQFAFLAKSGSAEV